MASRLPPDPGPGPGAQPAWLRVPVSDIEDLSDAVYGAGLRAIQMSRAPVSGSLVFAEHDGVTFSSGRLGGRVQILGPLSETQVSFGLAISFRPGARQWLREVATGDMGLFMPGDEHDALYSAGCLYGVATLEVSRAEEIAARLGRVLDIRRLGGSAVLPTRVDAHDLRELQAAFESLHADGVDSMRGGRKLLSAMLSQLGRLPRSWAARTDYRGRSRIVRRCREYIDEHIQGDVSVETLAAVAGTTTRTLQRAFADMLDETPVQYIRRLRLHRIHHELLAEPDRRDTVTSIAFRWGVTELGRFAGWYRDQFGELPSETLGHRSAPATPARGANLSESA
jgi:AraC-like DNA-binding protein